jgi:DNA-binding HxlR family transcriptional regulator
VTFAGARDRAQTGDVAAPSRPTVLEPGGENAIAVALGLLGDEWNLQILRYALNGVTRYGEWREVLPVSDAVLSGRLDRLTRAGMLTRVRYETRPLRHEYRITRRGRGTWPLLVAIWGWEATWVDEHVEPIPLLLHRRCGQTGWAELRCRQCLGPVGVRQVETRFGPSGGWARSVPATATRRRSSSGAGTAFPETMAVFGNRWSSAILGAAFLGARRFGEFEERLSAPPAVVSDRLRALVELGILGRVTSPAPALQGTYRLTDKGRAFFPVVLLTIEWAQRWFRAPEGPALVFGHTVAGTHRLRPVLACSGCAEVLEGTDIARLAAPVAAAR